VVSGVLLSIVDCFKHRVDVLGEPGVHLWREKLYLGLFALFHIWFLLKGS